MKKIIQIEGNDYLNGLEEYLLTIEPTKENYEKIKNQVEEIINFSKYLKQKEYTTIIFPSIPINIDRFNIKHSKFHKVIEEIISYSKSYSLTEKIIIGEKRVQCLMELSNQKNLQNFFDDFDSKIWLNLKEEIIQKIATKLQTYLKSILYSIFYNIDLDYLKRDNIIKQLNKYIERSCITDFDIHWANSLYKNYETDFILTIPYLEIKDLIYMFAIENLQDEKKNLNGFLLKSKKILLKEKATEFYKGVLNLLNEKEKNIEYIINSIFEISINTFLQEKIKLYDKEINEIKIKSGNYK